jgi:hypothetical protein
MTLLANAAGATVYPLSAQSGKGVGPLLDVLLTYVKEGKEEK